ncbi:Serine/threonine-protein kinase Sgk1 [Tritrichomonas foetus]|uniref:non-specific serine/threonine protein kinase n=1 Tax=Tritrichomonas foetus TaxID=1144522 RepID=A0A1J4K6M5_9EUKA|nr:Serine/threonine-protein kinase Sgk1 [Tritrichomonas foetus]|eukprot:OHT06835.1 Serine/threonine-protein kinase Sgk1 [Tritrichomonas foetus]
MSKSQYDPTKLDGNLKKKTKVLGAWKSCFAELNNTELILKKNEKAKKIDHQVKITHNTRIRYIEEGKNPRIVIEFNENENENITLTTKDSDNLVRWVLALRSATFYNPQISMDSFKIISVLGRGFFGKVMLVQKKDTKELFAIKTVHKARLIQSKKVQTILAERSILGKVKHPFIVEMNFAFQNATKFYLIMEYVPGGELFGLIKRSKMLPLTQVRLYIAEMALALQYLHKIGIVYRDLKPENILIATDGHLKLTDFGLSKDIGTVRLTKTFCGTGEFMAPEMIDQRLYAYAVDWWSLGILTYLLCFGKTPFFDENKAKMFKNITGSEPSFPKDADKEAVDLIKGLLTKDPQQRFGFEKVSKHKFFHKMNFDDVLNKKIKPEFIPEIKDPLKPEYFDAEFTNEAAVDSIATPSLEQEHEAFNGFSYIEGDDGFGFK